MSSPPMLQLPLASQKIERSIHVSSRVNTARGQLSNQTSARGLGLVKQGSFKGPLMKQGSSKAIPAMQTSTKQMQLLNSAQGFDMLKPSAGIFAEEDTEMDDVVFLSVQDGDAKALKKVVRKHRAMVGYVEPGVSTSPISRAFYCMIFDWCCLNKIRVNLHRYMWPRERVSSTVSKFSLKLGQTFWRLIMYD